jgi:hypothetical protein
MLRLFRAVISFEVEDGDARIGTAEWVDMQVATGGKTWWDFREPTQGALFIFETSMLRILVFSAITVTS